MLDAALFAGLTDAPVPELGFTISRENLTWQRPPPSHDIFVQPDPKIRKDVVRFINERVHVPSVADGGQVSVPFSAVGPSFEPCSGFTVNQDVVAAAELVGTVICW